MTATDTRRPSPTPAGTRSPRWTRDGFEIRFFGIARWVVIALLVVVTAFPFYYMALLSIRDLGSVLNNPGALWVDLKHLNLSAYKRVLVSVSSGGEGFLGFMRNSAVLSFSTVALTLLVSIPGSYAISRLRFFGRRQVSVLFLAVYLFPSIILAVPLFVFFTRVNMRGSLVAVLLVYVSQTVAVSIYMLRNYFDTIPVSLEEAAALDGCGRLATLWRISLPLAMPAILANALFIFMVAWNEFLFALLFLADDRSRWTVSLGLSELTGNSIEIPTTVLMAASVVTTIPIIVLFFASERLLAGGLTTGAEKG
ncbi:carbohydrate ABC transporter permease [Rugosimonospora acidiphila]|uniref:Carbohydrate ABC transporter permease n=1 Tax=Rugosimonospora acidiphila TaxID=556531 RepID=A0ABP9SG56_9ACTN